MTSAAPGDLALFERLRASDPEALEALMDRFASRLYRVACGICGSFTDAEEVVRDAFLMLFREAATFDGRASLGSWVYRIGVRTALNKRRGKRAELEKSLEDVLPTYLEDGHRRGDDSFLNADWSPMPDETLLSKEGHEVVHAAVERLPAHYRAVLLLRDVEELSSEDVAEILDESVASVKSQLHHARMALRELLSRTYAPGNVSCPTVNTRDAHPGGGSDINASLAANAPMAGAAVRNLE